MKIGCTHQILHFSRDLEIIEAIELIRTRRILKITQCVYCNMNWVEL